MLRVPLQIIFLHYVLSLTPVRELSIRRDVLAGIKAPEFSVFDKSGKNIEYRIESHYKWAHSIELVSYPSKQVVGRLKNKITWFLYEATFAILDPKTQKWISGNISQNLKILNHQSVIQWNGKRLLMERNFASLTTRFLDDQNAGQIVAEYKGIFYSALWARKYTLNIYTKDFPDAIFLFGLAVRDYIVTTRIKDAASKGNILDPTGIITSF